MTEFLDQDLTGARFENVSLRDSEFTKVRFTDSTQEWEHRLYAERDLTALAKEN